MKKFANEILTLFGIGTIVTLGWQGLELLFTGKITPSNIDTIVAIILSYSLFGNFKTWLSNKDSIE